MIEELGWPYVRVLGWDINIYAVVILVIIGYFIGAQMKYPVAGAIIGGSVGALVGAVHLK